MVFNITAVSTKATFGMKIQKIIDLVQDPENDDILVTIKDQKNRFLNWHIQLLSINGTDGNPVLMSDPLIEG